MKILSSLLLCAVVSISFAQESKTLEQLRNEGEFNRKVEQNQKAIAALSNLEALVESMSKSRNLACMKAFGEPKFCNCLSENLPIAISFANYVAITTQSKEENSYDTMPVNDRKAYDMVGPIRDKCVSALSKHTSSK